MLTIVTKACQEVEGFDQVCQRLEKRMIINGKCLSTFQNYLRCIAHLVIHYQALPMQITESEVEDYLFILKKKKAAESFFKHTIYGLRFLYRAEGMPALALRLPALRPRQIFPVVLNRSEVMEMLSAPLLLKHRVLIAVLYGCGLRCMEVRKLQICDIDFERNLIHVRQSKGGKDRCVPIGQHLGFELKNYLERDRPVKWLFNGKDFKDFSEKAIQRAVRVAQTKTAITKKVTPHTFRHTYATHLLEQGIDIVTIQKLLGHSYIQTTMIYLHVVHRQSMTTCSPLDTLFQKTDTNISDRVEAAISMNDSERRYMSQVLQKRAENRLKQQLSKDRQIEFLFC